MKKFDVGFYKIKSDIFKALGHPIRLAVFDFLNNKEKCVCEICSFVQSSYANVSKHLSILKNAGLIDSHKNGNHIYYFIKMSCAINFNECINNVIKNNIKNQNKLLKKIK
jgi:ArsR family transcriptional regulator